MKTNELNSTQSTITRQIDAVITFAPYSYPFGNDLVGYIYGEAMIREEISQFNRIVLDTSGQVQNGLINLSAQISLEPGAQVFIAVLGAFGTTLGHTAGGFNVGGANVHVQVYLDGVLQPESYSGSNYSQFYVLLLVSAPLNPCNEEIVVCNNLQPQKFNDQGVGTIEKLQETSTWNWIDPVDGEPKTASPGDGCMINPDPKVLGITYLLEKIGPYTSSLEAYRFLEDLKIKVCLDNSDPNNEKWRFSVNNFRVPIYEDLCLTHIQQQKAIDLKDGTDQSLLSQYIKNCSDFKLVMRTLDFYYIGPYSQPCLAAPSQFIFSAGILAHEEKHFQDKKTAAIKEFDGLISPVLVTMDRPKKDYPCPEDALGPDHLSGTGTRTRSEEIKALIQNSIISATNLSPEKVPVICIPKIFPIFTFVKQIELDADVEARPTYKDIKENITNWARLQSWWNVLDPNCR